MLPAATAPTPIVPTPKSEAACRYWLKGACRSGGECRFQHAATTAKSNVVTPAHPPPTNSNNTTTHANVPSDTSSSSTPSTASSASVSPSLGPSIGARDYGWTKPGAHHTAPSTAANAAATRYAGGQTSKIPPTAAPLPRVISDVGTTKINLLPQVKARTSIASSGGLLSFPAPAAIKPNSISHPLGEELVGKIRSLSIGSATSVSSVGSARSSLSSSSSPAPSTTAATATAAGVHTTTRGSGNNSPHQIRTIGAARPLVLERTPPKPIQTVATGANHLPPHTITINASASSSSSTSAPLLPSPTSASTSASIPSTAGSSVLSSANVSRTSTPLTLPHASHTPLLTQTPPHALQAPAPRGRTINRGGTNINAQQQQQQQPPQQLPPQQPPQQQLPPPVMPLMMPMNPMVGVPSMHFSPQSHVPPQLHGLMHQAQFQPPPPPMTFQPQLPQMHQMNVRPTHQHHQHHQRVNGFNQQIPMQFINMMQEQQMQLMQQQHHQQQQHLHLSHPSVSSSSSQSFPPGISSTPSVSVPVVSSAARPDRSNPNRDRRLEVCRFWLNQQCRFMSEPDLCPFAHWNVNQNQPTTTTNEQQQQSASAPSDINVSSTVDVVSSPSLSPSSSSSSSASASTLSTNSIGASSSTDSSLPVAPILPDPLAPFGGWLAADRVHTWRSLVVLEKSNAETPTDAGITLNNRIPSPTNPQPSHLYKSTLNFYSSDGLCSDRTFHSFFQTTSPPTSDRGVIKFLREIVEFLEHEHKIEDYHLCIVESKKATRPTTTQTATKEADGATTDGGAFSNDLDVKSVKSIIADPNNWHVKVHFGGAHTPLPIRDKCMGCDDKDNSSLIEQLMYNNVWLDAQGRSMLIVTPHSHHERITALTDAQLYALYFDAYSFMRDAKKHVLDALNDPSTLPTSFTFETLILNQGLYRNFAHLHLKARIPQTAWELLTLTNPAANVNDPAPFLHHKYGEQMKQVARLSQDPTLKKVQRNNIVLTTKIVAKNNVETIETTLVAMEQETVETITPSTPGAPTQTAQAPAQATVSSPPSAAHPSPLSHPPVAYPPPSVPASHPGGMWMYPPGMMMPGGGLPPHWPALHPPPHFLPTPTTITPTTQQQANEAMMMNHPLWQTFQHQMHQQQLQQQQQWLLQQLMSQKQQQQQSQAFLDPAILTAGAASGAGVDASSAPLLPLPAPSDASAAAATGAPAGVGANPNGMPLTNVPIHSNPTNLMALLNHSMLLQQQQQQQSNFHPMMAPYQQVTPNAMQPIHALYGNANPLNRSNRKKQRSHHHHAPPHVQPLVPPHHHHQPHQHQHQHAPLPFSQPPAMMPTPAQIMQIMQMQQAQAQAPMHTQQAAP